MGVVGTNLTTGNANTTSGPTTASISPTANQLVLVAVGIENDGTPSTAPTLSGAGMTWVQVNSRLSSSHNTIRITVFRSMSASPGSGALTITCGETEDHVLWSVDQFSGTDTTGTNGSGAIVQNVGNDQFATATSFAITLAALSSSANVAFGSVIEQGLTSLTLGSGFTSLSNFAGTNNEFSTEYQMNTTNVNWTFASTNLALVGLAIEIKAKSTSGFFMMM